MMKVFVSSVIFYGYQFGVALKTDQGSSTNQQAELEVDEHKQVLKKEIKQCVEDLEFKGKDENDDEDWKGKDRYGYNLLHKISGKKKYSHLIEPLIKEFGFDPNEKLNCAGQKEAPYGWTPLIFAVASGSKENVEVLLKNGSDVNAEINYAFRDDQYVKYQEGLVSTTPLHVAVEKGNYEVLPVLLEYGANRKAEGKFWKWNSAGCALRIAPEKTPLEMGEFKKAEVRKSIAIGRSIGFIWDGYAKILENLTKCEGIIMKFIIPDLKQEIKEAVEREDWETVTKLSKQLEEMCR